MNKVLDSAHKFWWPKLQPIGTGMHKLHATGRYLPGTESRRHKALAAECVSPVQIGL